MVSILPEPSHPPAAPRCVSRLAPTPSGFLHPGNVFSFVLTWLLVRSQEGQLVLRIDDLDAARFRMEYLEDLFVTLDWLGLDYDVGPSGPTDFLHHFSQQHRMPLYSQALEALTNTGAIFACDCSRKQVLQESPDGQYSGRCRNRGLSLAPVSDAQGGGVLWRLRTPPETLETVPDLVRDFGHFQLYQCQRDFGVRRRDGLPAYQLASVVDDLHFGVNLIVRGEDLLDSSAAQRFLARTLAQGGIETTPFLQAQFLHHPLLYENPERKMSKSHGDLSIRALRARLKDPTPILGWVGNCLGMSRDDSSSLAGLLAAFRLERLRKGSLNGETLRWGSGSRLPAIPVKGE